MVPVSFNDYIIVHRMIHQIETQRSQLIILTLIRREEPYIKVSSLDIDPVSSGRIERVQCLSHVFRRIRILETVPQDYLVMRDITSIRVVQPPLCPEPFLAARHRQNCHEHKCDLTSHNSFI